MMMMTLDDLLAQHTQHGKPYLEFLRLNALSMGMYRLPAGSIDSQHPHAEDEVYYVTAGRAQIRVGSADYPVAPGSIVYVPAQVSHGFHSITEDLTLLVFFAPAESAGFT
ncbi:MAG: cupin domain-containing protein [Anaerolineae bacterium]|nr:cupin domain-containing protein [Anaerolineae bacterium]